MRFTVSMLWEMISGQAFITWSISSLRPWKSGISTSVVVSGFSRLISRIVCAANYHTSLEVIRQIAESGITAKSGIMVGLGETPAEVEELMDDLISVGCKILTIGQYLQPTHKHFQAGDSWRHYAPVD